MRKHGWQLPYHPLQVVAVAVFLALGFSFYVFFAPFVGSKNHQYIAMGIYSPLITCVVGLYIWCAASDPADRGVFRSKKYLKVPENGKLPQSKDTKDSCRSTPGGAKSHDGMFYCTLRSSNTASIAEFVTNVWTVLIITAGG